MNLLNTITAIGIPSIAAALIYIGRKLQVLDDVKKTLNGEFKDTIGKMKLNIKVIADALIQSGLVDGGKLQAYSPIQVTQIGKDYLEKIGFIKTFNEHSEDFFRYIESEQPKTDYDIENAAIRSIYLLFDKDYFNPIKDYLYNNPKEDKKELTNVAGIYVRDMYLSRKGERNKSA